MKSNIVLYLFISLAAFLVLIVGYCCTNEPPANKSISFHNGQILLPDYVHIDTLIVTDAEFLNKHIAEVEIDGDINDLLCITTEIK